MGAANVECMAVNGYQPAAWDVMVGFCICLHLMVRLGTISGMRISTEKSVWTSHVMMCISILCVRGTCACQ